MRAEQKAKLLWYNIFMLIYGAKIDQGPILSLHTGGEIARVRQPIINPDNLRIVAFYLSGRGVNAETGDVLGIESIREVSRIGMIIDSTDEFYHLEDVARVKKIAELNFHLIGIRVETEKGQKLGRVTNFTVNSDNFAIMQIMVQRPFFKSFREPELLIGRSQIKEITDDKIVVKEEKAKIKATAKNQDFVPNFVNPFREGRFATAQNQNLDESDIGSA